jgi:hypothetical protein
MRIEELSAFFRKNCRFRLKNGREVYGVIWTDDSKAQREYYFASASDHRLYEIAKSNNETQMHQMLKHPVDINDIVQAERLAS